MKDNSYILPEDYMPFPEIVICSNKLINGTIPITISKHIPFLVGFGDIPLIWISGPVSKDGSLWREIVAKNQPIDDRANIIEEDNNISILYDNNIIINVIKLSDNKAEILYLDLRPIGLDIFGDINGLFISKSNLFNNSFKNVFIMIGLG